MLRPLLDLGVTPIASVTHPRAEGAFRFVDEYDVSDVEVIGLLGEPNMEQLALLKPDLIIGTLSAGTNEQVDTLSEIAPTVVYNAGRPVIEDHRSLAEGVRRYWISLEKLPEHDGDLIFLVHSGNPATNTPITESPIWGQLAAVKAGQVVEVDGSTWYVQSVRSLFSVVDALEQHLLEGEVNTGVVE